MMLKTIRLSERERESDILTWSILPNGNRPGAIICLGHDPRILRRRIQYSLSVEGERHVHPDSHNFRRGWGQKMRSEKKARHGRKIQQKQLSI